MRTSRIALTRAVPPALGDCELTHLERTPIDVDRARRQHAAYEAALEDLGCRIVRLPERPEHPDSVFVEDVLVVLDEIAIVTRPGAESRRAETDGVGSVVRRWRPVAHIEPPGTLDGGDVLRVGRRLYVGGSTRTDEAGMAALARITGPLGYEVRRVPIDACLHLKSAATALRSGLILANPGWIDPDAFEGVRVLAVDPSEPFAANVLRVGDAVMVPLAHEKTRRRIEAAGLRTVPVDVSELAKAEGGVTCCSVLMETGPQTSRRSA